MSGGALAILAVVGLVLTGGFWFYRMNQVRTAEVRSLVIGLMGVVGLLAIASFASGPGLPGGIAAGFALLASGFFLALQLQAGQSTAPPAVQVGGPILDFQAVDDRGASFDTAGLRGKPYLLKFFRGHW